MKVKLLKKVRRNTAIIQTGGNSFVVRFWGDRERFRSKNEAFDHLINSIKEKFNLHGNTKRLFKRR